MLHSCLQSIDAFIKMRMTHNHVHDESPGVNHIFANFLTGVSGEASKIIVIHKG